jgi:F-type H+-transporting ATPase subunit delta
MHNKNIKLAKKLAQKLSQTNIDACAVYAWKNLQKTGGLSELDNFIGKIRTYTYSKSNKVPVKIISARELSQKEQTTISEKLEIKLGKKLVAEYEVRTSILGGIIIKMQDLIIDYSWRGKLGKLKTNLESL